MPLASNIEVLGKTGGYNIILNSNFEVCQRDNLPKSNIGFGFDMVRGSAVSAGGNMSLSTDVPNLASKYSLQLNLTTKPSGTRCWYLASLRNEGYQILPLLGKTVTLSFWVKSTKSGFHYLNINNDNSGKDYVYRYTINSANTWEKKEHTFDWDTTSTWLTGNSLALSINLYMGVNEDSLTTSLINQWVDNDLKPSWLTLDAGDVLKFSQFKLEEGNEATPYVPLHYAQELEKLKRYYEILVWRNYAGATTSASSMWQYLRYNVRKRTDPSLSVSDYQMWYSGTWYSDVTFNYDQVGQEGARCCVTRASTYASLYGGLLDATFKIDASP
jgi:hypothetical protein